MRVAPVNVLGTPAVPCGVAFRTGDSGRQEQKLSPPVATPSMCVLTPNAACPHPCMPRGVPHFVTPVSPPPLLGHPEVWGGADPTSVHSSEPPENLPGPVRAARGHRGRGHRGPAGREGVAQVTSWMGRGGGTGTAGWYRDPGIRGQGHQGGTGTLGWEDRDTGMGGQGSRGEGTGTPGWHRDPRLRGPWDGGTGTPRWDRDPRMAQGPWDGGTGTPGSGNSDPRVGWGLWNGGTGTPGWHREPGLRTQPSGWWDSDPGMVTRTPGWWHSPRGGSSLCSLPGSGNPRAGPVPRTPWS